MDVFLRDLKQADLRAYRQLISPDRAFHQFNGPYFGCRMMQNKIAILSAFGKNFKVMIRI